jgi:hypothetical protein
MMVLMHLGENENAIDILSAFNLNGKVKSLNGR